MKKSWKMLGLVLIAIGIFLMVCPHKEPTPLVGRDTPAYAALERMLKAGWTLIALSVGATLGSYAITILSRRRAKEPIISVDFKKLKYHSPQSHCFSCGHKLIPRDVIPVISYIRYRGRCRYCGAKYGEETILYESLGLLAGMVFAVFVVWGL